MEVKTEVRAPRLKISQKVLDRARSEGKAVLVRATLKFSCLIAKRTKVELVDTYEEGDYETRIEGVPVIVSFRVIGSRFCGGDVGFEEVDFPVKDPARFFPKWIKVGSDLSGDFGYA